MSSELHRKLVVLSGDANWCRRALRGMPATASTVWIGCDPPVTAHCVQAGQVASLLGSECDLLVFDAHAGFDPNAVGISSGLVRGGGAFILLLPPLPSWSDETDPQAVSSTVYGYQQYRGASRFLSRFSRLLYTSSEVMLVEQLNLHDPDYRLQWQSILTPGGPTRGTEDQKQAVAAICRVAGGHRKRPLVMLADRGRGKSAALGIAAAELLQQGKQTIVVTAPRQDATRALFEHAATALPSAQIQHGSISLNGASIVFRAPDELTLNPLQADLLLVDEAAGIPIPILERLLKRYARIAFATTVHGYEGTGRGFSLRFSRILQRNSPQWKRIVLHTPVRWAADDPLERFTFKALLLDAEPVGDEQLGTVSPEQLVVSRLERDQLLGSEALLRQVFGLLVSAHYRTTPFDLRNLLDGPNISVWTGACNGAVVAAMLVAREGGSGKKRRDCRNSRARSHDFQKCSTIYMRHSFLLVYIKVAIGSGCRAQVERSDFPLWHWHNSLFWRACSRNSLSLVFRGF